MQGLLVHHGKTAVQNVYKQKQLSRSVLMKRCAENVRVICRRTPVAFSFLFCVYIFLHIHILRLYLFRLSRYPMPKCDFNKVVN